MNSLNNLSEQIEQEIKKQLQLADKRADRHGWLYLIMAVLTIFIAVYFTNQYIFNRQIPDDNVIYHLTQGEADRLNALEKRVQELEQQLQSKNDEQSQ